MTTVTPIRPGMAEYSDNGVTTIGPLVALYIERRRKQGTLTLTSVRSVRPRLDTLARSFGRRPLDQFGRRAVERWLESLEHLSTNSRASYLASARQFTLWLNVEGYTATDACAQIPKLRRAKGVPRALNADQVAALLAACRDDRELAVVWLMVGCGLRRAEVARARWEDYDTRARTLLVHGKGAKERIVPVPRSVAGTLARIQVANTGPIIRSQLDGRSPLTPERVGQMMTAAFRRAGLKVAAWDGMSGHALRHTCATDVFERCHDLRAVQQMLGHSSLTSTEVYLARSPSELLREAMDGLSYLPDAA